MTYKLVVVADKVEDLVFDLDVETDDEALLTLVAAGHLYHNQWVEVTHAVYEWESGEFRFAYDHHGRVISEAAFKSAVADARLNEEGEDDDE